MPQKWPLNRNGLRLMSPPKKYKPETYVFDGIKNGHLSFKPVESVLRDPNPR